MHFRRQTTGSQRYKDCDPGAPVNDPSCPVRLSILSRELLVAILLIGVAGYLISMSDDGMMVTQPLKKSVHGHELAVERMVYAADGRTLVSCGWDKRVRFWNVAPDQPEWGKEFDSLPHEWPVFGFALSDDQGYLATGGAGGFTIWTRQSKDGTWNLSDEHRGGNYRCLAASPDNHTLAVGGCDGVLRLWDIHARKQPFVLDRFGDQLRMMAFSPSGSLIAACTFSGEFRIWDLTTPAAPHVLAGSPESVRSFVFAPDNQTMAVAQAGPHATTLGLWDLRTFNRRLPLADNLADNNALAFSPDGRIMASADQDSTIRFWNTKTGELEKCFHDRTVWVKALAFSPDGRQLAFGGNDGTIHFQNL